MFSSPDPTGELLRRYRLHNQLTLAEASRKFGYSTAVLSRLERGLRLPNRSELLLLIHGYNLSYWEAHSLLTSAGFLPELPMKPAYETERAQLLTILEQLTLPAFLMDASGYIHACNTPLQALWHLRSDGSAHILDQVFSPALRKAYGDNWRKRAMDAVWHFYLLTLYAPNQRNFPYITEQLGARHGAAFQEIWQAVIARSDGSRTNVSFDRHSAETEYLGTLTVEYETVAGRIAYLLTRSGIHIASEMAIYMLIPLGKENMIRHTHLQSTQERVRTIILEDANPAQYSA